MKKMLDLFSGFGGASESFLNDDAWHVLRIENNPLLASVPNTRSMCVFEFRDWLLEQKNRYGPFDVELVWASPPCTEFSTAYGSPRSIAQRAGEDYEPYMGFLTCAIEIIEIIQPRYWVIENVRGAIKFFEAYLGAPSQIHQAYVLWGNYPKFQPGQFPTKAQKDKRWDPLRSNHRALVPMEISAGLKDSINRQLGIFDFTSMESC